MMYHKKCSTCVLQILWNVINVIKIIFKLFSIFKNVLCLKNINVQFFLVHINKNKIFKIIKKLQIILFSITFTVLLDQNFVVLKLN